MTGNDNVGVGHETINAMTSGTRNVAVGAGALSTTTTGADNVAVGYRALYVGNASFNTAIGGSALRSNTTGTANTAVGVNAMRSNLTGVSNVAVGADALFTSTGSSNTAVGNNALELATGNYNLAMGDGAGINQTTGNANTLVGTLSGQDTITGSYNVGLGYSAMDNLQSGSGNTTINPMTSAGIYAPAFDITTQNNIISMGSTSVTDAYIQVGFTAVSDERDKTEIAPLTRGLNFVNQLQPVSYRFRVERENDEAHGPTRLGFLAQEMLDVELSLDNRALVIDNDDADRLRYRSDAMVPILVKAIQELTARVAALEAI